MTSSIKVLPEYDLDQIKILVLNDFWRIFGEAYGVKSHGSTRQVRIIQGKRDIQTTEEIRRCMQVCQEFQVIFQHT